MRRPRWARGCLVLILTSLLVLTLNAAPAHAAGFFVNSALDEVDANIGDGICSSTPSAKCTLRAAIQEANASTGVPDTISLPAGVYTLTYPDLPPPGPAGSAPTSTVLMSARTIGPSYCKVTQWGGAGVDTFKNCETIYP